MSDLKMLADLAGRHTPHDVYDLWTESRPGAVLFGWQTAAGGQVAFCLDGNAKLHPVAAPWTAEEAGRRWSEVSHGEGTLRVEHELGVGGDPANFGVRCDLDGEATEFHEDGASLLFPVACLDADGRAFVALVRTEDVENADGVVDQHNHLMVARHDGDGWRNEQVAGLAYGLLPRAGVWGYPGKRRRPYMVPDDRGGVWVLWERKEPHDGNTRIATGALLGRRWNGTGWGDPVRVIADAYLDYAPDRTGVVEGRLVVAAQRAVPYTEPGRGEVVLLAVELDACPAQPGDDAVEGWERVDLARREYFRPADRVVAPGDGEYHLLFGDPHTHTALSEDAEGDLVEMISYARDKAKLDFVAVTDNDYIYGGRLSDGGWRETMRQAQRWSEDGRFIVIPAYEWTQARWGATVPQHRSILFGSYDQTMLRWADAANGPEGDAFEALLSWVRTTDGIMNTQHPRFLLSTSDREANMEVISGWGDYINTSECFHEHLNRGCRAGFVGASDGHRRTPGLGGGLTGLWVREFTLAGIIEAMRCRRCYATAGARIGLKFSVNDAFMGETMPAAESYRAHVAVDAPLDVSRLEVFGDGEVVASLRGLPARFQMEMDDLPACRWYYVKVTMPGGFPKYPSNIAPAEGPWAWSSPVFVNSPQTADR